jgi:hypothetical protein
LVLDPFIVAFVPVFCPRVWLTELFRAEELAERRLRVTAPITPGSRSKSSARDLVVKYVYAVEVCIVVAAGLAAAADAVLVAHHLQNVMPIGLPHGLLKK